MNRSQHLTLWIREHYCGLVNTNQPFLIYLFSFCKGESGVHSLKIELWTKMKVQYCLEIGWKRYNEYLRWWRCLLKQENKNRWYGFVNDGMKIKRLNYQVFVKTLPTYQGLTIFHKALINKSVIDELYPKTNKLVLKNSIYRVLIPWFINEYRNNQNLLFNKNLNKYGRTSP